MAFTYLNHHMSNSPETLIVEGKDKVENVNKATSNLADKKTVNSDITHVPTLLTHNISIPFGIVFVVNMLGWLHILPIFIQLLLNSASCVFIGCVLSTKLRINSLGVLENASK